MNQVSFLKRIYNKFVKISVPLGYAMGVAAFVFLFRGEDKKKWAAFWGICVVTVLISFILALIEILREKSRDNGDRNELIVAKVMKDTIKRWYDDERYGDVITYGKALGRALYISASYKTRIEIGEIVKKAAEHLDDSLLLCDILLDDLGWTKFICGKKDDAITDITSAINIATAHHYYKEISKGYRHLTAIEVSVWNSPQKAHQYLDKAYDAMNCLEEGRDKEIVFAGLLFASSELAFKEKNFDLAMQKAKESEAKRKTQHELDRHMRFYAQIGKIELYRPDGNIREAREYFRKGIEESESVNRIDELLKNAYGFAICSIKMGERKKAKKIAGDFIKKYGNIPLYTEDELLRKDYLELIRIEDST